MPERSPEIDAADGPLGWWAALWVLAVVLLIAGSLNPVTKPPNAHHIDKFVHLLVYGALAGLPALRLRRVRAALLIAVVLVAIGCAIEVLQGLVPGRQGSVGDALANTLGIALGFAAGRQLRLLLPWAWRRGA
jgi:VanZ family protein